MDRILARRLVGTAGVILVIALGYLGMRARYAPPQGSYLVTAVLGDAGSGLTQGSDVKVRGVAVGEVAALSYEDGIATAQLRLDAQPRLPAPDQLELVVTAKTLLGEKQVELSFEDRALDQPPFLTAGDTLTTDREPTELAEAIEELERVVDAIDAQDLAEIVDAFGAQQGEGDVIADNLELGDELAAFGARTAEQNLANLRALTDIVQALEPRVEDFNRLNRNVPAATRLLREEQRRIAVALQATSAFARDLDRFLRVEEDVIDRVLATGDPVGAFLEQRAPQIGSLIDGIAVYSRALGAGGLLIDDGSEWAPFRIFIDPEDFELEQFLCAINPECVDGEFTAGTGHGGDA